jgi:subtilisin family serine protease
VKYAEQQVIREHVKRDYVVPTDPGWPQEWSLKNTGQTGTSSPLRLDSRVEQAWLQGFTGQGVLVAVVDEGLEWKHRDLIDNYNAQLSFDFIGNDSDPTPEKGHTHGTECAGVIAMSKNKYCGIGVAYDSTLVGIKTEIEVSVDLSEAASLSHAQDSIDVYSNSWGPKDNGFTIEAIGPLVTRTFENGAEKGRNGKGNIYVWAAGNGGDSYDSCAADGFVNSIYTIAVGSADQNGQQAYYDEDCSAKMAVTFSYNSDTFPAEDDAWTAYNQTCTTTASV